MKPYFFKLFLCLFFFFCFIGQNSAQVNFLEVSFEDLLEKSVTENKPIFLFLSNNNNECWWMEHNVFNDYGIGEYFNKNFVCGIFFGQINYTNLSTEKLKIKEYPFFLFYDPKTQAGYSATGGKTLGQIFNYGKAVANEFKMLKVISHQISDIEPGATSATYQIPDNDGRYTLGVRGRRLMYGYPYPNSTSHFVVNVDDNMASNSPRFLIDRDLNIEDYLEKKGFFARIFGFFRKKKKKIKIKSYDNVSYLYDTLNIKFDKSNSMHSAISYRFNGLKITQKLSPLNKNLEACRAGDSARYYQVDYIIENNSNKRVNVGLLVLFDTMIDDNDAAKMDVFKTEYINHITPGQKRSIAKRRGKYVKHGPSDDLKRILVYRNKELTKDLTGDFRIVTPPDEIHIGSWPVFYSVLWDMPKIKTGEKYFDSAVILKWLKQSLPPGDKLYFTSIFGIYNKGVLELIPAGTNFTGSSKEGKRVRPGKPEFVAIPDTIYEGQSSVLYWKTDNPLNADIYVSAKPKTKQRNKGRATVSPKKTTTYYLQMLDQGKEVAKVSARVTFIKRPEKIEMDGKYTIGSKNRPLTFGYPFPYSTSFFQIYNKKKYYSNNKLDNKSTYLPGKQYENTPENKKHILSYESKNFEIEQYLIPLDASYKLTAKDSAVYYRCEYLVKNLTESKSTFSFRQILDFSALTTNDLQLKINDKIADFNKTHVGKKVPSSIFIGNEAKKEGVIVLPSVSGTERPVSVSIGDWHFLKNMEIKTSYSDSTFYRSPAVLIRWKKTVEGKANARFAFIVGAANKEFIDYQYNQASELKSVTVNFETNKYRIKKEKEEEITNFIKQNQFDFIVLEGFTDNRGTLEKNYQLAKKRIENIKNIIIENGGLDQKKILYKVHGEFFSNQKSKNKEVDDLHERKVKIILLKNEE